MSLSLLIILPLVTALCLLFAKGAKSVKAISLTGAAVQLTLSFVLLFLYWQNTNTPSPMQFEENHVWFKTWSIHYHVGVDGISIAMILLTAFVVLAGVLVSWAQEVGAKNSSFY